MRRVKWHEVSGKAKPSGLPTRPVGNTTEFPFSFVPLPCGCISFPGEEIMPHPFLPLLQQLPSSHHSHDGGSGQSREGPPPSHSSWGVKEAWGLSKEEMFSLLGMRVMPGEGRDTFPLRCKLLLLSFVWSGRVGENNVLTNTNRPFTFLRPNFKGIIKYSF